MAKIEKALCFDEYYAMENKVKNGKSLKHFFLSKYKQTLIRQEKIWCKLLIFWFRYIFKLKFYKICFYVD